MIKLGITAGDPAGIGAEVAVKALERRELYDKCVPLLIGDRAVIEDALKIRGGSFRLRRVDTPEQARGEYGLVDLLDMKSPASDGSPGGTVEYGKVSARYGEAAFRYIKKAAELALEGRIAALVTGPINKEALNLAGHHYAGHTEILADLTKTRDYAMLLCCGPLRVVHVTTHVSLVKAVELVKAPRIFRVIQLAREGLRLLGCSAPRIAVAGLNPHASENGLFGGEEKLEIVPAVEQARSEGIDIEGPLPPDTVFVKAMGGQFDGVIAMYHDQGHIPLKLAGFTLDTSGDAKTRVSGVNCSLGLPIIRTSVDHGTAFDRAGKNCSSEQSMVEAIETALIMAANRGEAEKRGGGS
ncbi:MAG: 4-hydroxythreonine-4-phosphate dehydrogenase PdxA [Treponema sp.]|jgi:4-hydroxythreonine-4-phosphate dehydrogenase|nr:4-hydroxythreonine-4-phosphate dehydrogenase PdxA [Treponema sp.]